MGPFAFEDRLELLGILAGAFVVVVALGTMLEPPWTTNESTGAAAVQTFGVVLAIVVGLLLIQISYRGDLRSLLPGRGDASE